MFGWKINEYDIKLELTECFKGTVYMAQYIPNGEHIVFKKYRLEKSNKEEIESICHEIFSMRQFNHPNLMCFHTAFVHDTDLCLVAPLMCFGSCRDTIRNCFNTGFPEILIALVLRDTLSGLEYLHRRGYIHRSIRGSHILLNQTKAVLSGFRDCTSFLLHGDRIRRLHKLPDFNTHSLNWLAPEVLEQNIIGYTEKSDIYSIGITCCELANGIEPFADDQPTFMFTEKLRGNIPTLLDRTTCPAAGEALETIAHSHTTDSVLAAETQQIYLKRSFSDDFHQFTEICLEKKAPNRWPVMKLLSHAFFKQCRHNSILDVTQRFGMQKADYDQLRDESLSSRQETAGETGKDAVSTSRNKECSPDQRLNWSWEF